MIESPEPNICNIKDFKNHYLFNFIHQMNGQNLTRISIIGSVWDVVYRLFNWSERLEFKRVPDQFRSW